MNTMPPLQPNNSILLFSYRHYIIDFVQKLSNTQFLIYIAKLYQIYKNCIQLIFFVEESLTFSWLNTNIYKIANICSILFTLIISSLQYKSIHYITPHTQWGGYVFKPTNVIRWLSTYECFMITGLKNQKRIVRFWKQCASHLVINQFALCAYSYM